jgi:hypothetical protein
MTRPIVVTGRCKLIGNHLASFEDQAGASPSAP